MTAQRDASESVDDHFWVSLSELAGVSTVVIQGELDLATVPLVEAKVNEALARPGAVAIDVTPMGFMDSSGLGLLARAYRRTRGEGRTLVVRNPQPTVERTLEIAGLDFLIEGRVRAGG